MARRPTASTAPLTNSAPPIPTPTTRTSTRVHARQASTSTVGPSTPVILTPSEPHLPASTSRLHAKQAAVEAKTHALRSVFGEKEREPCPFPGQYGGAVKCGLSDEDEKDEVLMATCAACCSIENRALSLEEIAVMSYDRGWLRPPSAAIAPSTVINNAIRAHLKRCETTVPPRQPLLNKHQLSGAVNESVLEPALHPHAFRGSIRPKGTVWYLMPAGKAKWRNPFEGIELPKPPPRKPTTKSKSSKENRGKKEERGSKGKAKINGPVKIRLVLNGGVNPVGEEEGSDLGSSSQGSTSRSRSRSSCDVRSVTPMDIPHPTPLHSVKRLSRRVRDILDSSSGSDSSDSEMDLDLASSRPRKPSRTMRKAPPPPLAITSSPRVSHHPHRPAPSPFADLFFSSSNPLLSAIPPYVQHIQSQVSPFPTHSLDNTTWTVRHDHDRFASFETSSSSSDDEIREPEGGMISGILIRGEDGDDKAVWTAEDEEMKVKEATDALRVLFPLASPEEEVDVEPEYELNRLDNYPAPSDTSSLAESSSTATAQAISKGQLKVYDLSSSIALSAWTASSSPAPSPNLRAFAHLAPETSPTQHLSKLSHSLDPDAMDVDEDKQWLDESGELPVKAEDTFSDIDLGSTIGDAPTPERDRQLHTAEWAREAAVSAAFRMRDETGDYPSPMTTEPDDQSAVVSRGSRASSTPSSGSSELTPFDMESERVLRSSPEEVIVGPESISVEELDGWLPTVHGKMERTPQRGKHHKYRHHPQRCSGNWGSIGVGTALALNAKTLPQTKTTSTIRTRSIRSSNRRRRSSPQPYRLPTPPRTDEADIEQEEVLIEIDDAIGTADLEQARVEAETREEAHRKACREKGEQQKALLEAYRQKVRECHDTTPPEGLPTGSGSWDHPSPWSDLGPTSWGSSESINIATPSALSPMVLHGVSSLSLGKDLPPFPSSMDPKVLLSPPILGSSTGIANLDDIMSQLEVEAVMSAIQSSPLPTSFTSPFASLPTMTTSPTSIEETSTTSADTVRNIVDLPTALPDDVTTTEPIKTMPPPTARPPATFTKRLCPGVDACVVDNIPVYSLVSETKAGKVVVLRRLDTDFVNGTSLLAALGVSPAKYAEYLNAPSTTLASHRTVSGSVAGVNHSVGVPGVWVQLAEAKEYAKKLHLGEGTILSNILRGDLFQMFATLAGIKRDHAAAETFGLPFIARRSQTAKPTPKGSVLPASSANSRSTPNLTSLTSISTPTTAHVRASTTPKGPLVRSASPTGPDGGSHPKRRRATIVGEFSPLLAAKPGVTTRKDKAAMTAAARRATRASVGGETPKPKVVK